MNSLPLEFVFNMVVTLNTIIENKRHEVEKSKIEVPLAKLKQLVDPSISPRNFFGSVVNGHTTNSTSVIAEIKRKSPSAGVLCENFDPISIAKSYENAGAAAISCLTDENFFGGHLSYIKDIKAHVSLPVLRKDFIIDDYQIWESRAAGADAILFIAEILSEGQLVDYLILAQSLGMTSLVESHDLDNLIITQQYTKFPHAGYNLLGINNRNLKTMKTDLSHTIRMVDVVEDASIIVSESGIKSPEDLDKLRANGIHIVLVGESLMKDKNPGKALAKLIRMNPT